MTLAFDSIIFRIDLDRLRAIIERYEPPPALVAIVDHPAQVIGLDAFDPHDLGVRFDHLPHRSGSASGDHRAARTTARPCSDRRPPRAGDRSRRLRPA